MLTLLFPQLLILSELLANDPATTLVNKHASHVWSKVMDLTWEHTSPPPAIFARVNAALRGKWVDLACHETGSLVVQHAFENLDEREIKELVEEILQGFDKVVKDQWGSKSESSLFFYLLYSLCYNDRLGNSTP